MSGDMGNLEEADTELAWKLQEEEVSSVTGLQSQVCGQSDWHTLPDSDVAMFTGAEVEDDEKFAQRIYDQQVAYSMQIESDQAVAQALTDEADQAMAQALTDEADQAMAQALTDEADQAMAQALSDDLNTNQDVQSAACMYRPRGQGHQSQSQGPSMPFSMFGLQVIPIGGMPDGTLTNDYEALMDLAERIGDAHNPGLATNELDALPTQVFHNTQQGAATAGGDSTSGGTTAVETQCKICLEDFDEGDDLRTLPCCHRYHKLCIDNWLQRKATCPVCKLEVKDQLRHVLP